MASFGNWITVLPSEVCSMLSLELDPVELLVVDAIPEVEVAVPRGAVVVVVVVVVVVGGEDTAAVVIAEVEEETGEDVGAGAPVVVDGGDVVPVLVLDAMISGPTIISDGNPRN